MVFRRAFCIVLLLIGITLLSCCGQDPITLNAPQVTLDSDTATWTADSNAEKFEISVDGELSYLENTVTTKKLQNGQTFKIRAVGDGENYLTSAWSNSVTYVDLVKPEDKTYTVTWKNGEDVLEVDENVAYGATPTYNGSVPEKQSTPQYHYSFSGWSPKLGAVVESVTYEAQFEATLRSYTVTFYSEDGLTILDKLTVKYGSEATYTKSTPVKSATEDKTYSFSGWVTEIGGSTPIDLSAIKSNTYAYASFREQVRVVSVRIISSNTTFGTVTKSVIENVPFGSSITVNGQSVTINGETVEADCAQNTPQYTYAFSGWECDTTVGSDTLITAKFSRVVNTYTVTWKNGDEVLEIDENVAYGTTPTYNGTIPQKEADEKIYTFSGWSPVISGVEGNVTYSAQFTDTENKHVVIYYDEDGITELGRVIVGYGENAVYPNALPTKESTPQKTYAFSKWVTTKGGQTEAVFESVTEDMSVYASYTETLRSYTVAFCDYDGEIIEEQLVEWGKSAIAPTSPMREGYQFVGWDREFSNITEDITVRAKYRKELRIEFVDYDGTVLHTAYVLASANGEPTNFTDIPQDPVRSSYAFTGWSITDFSNIVEDVTVTAHYVRVYKVSFVYPDNEVIETQFVRSGDSAKAPTDIDLEGYDFVGWDKDFSEITEDTTVKAIYEIKKYTVKFVDVQGKLLLEKVVEHGSPVAPPKVPESYFDWATEKGYAFTGWDKSYMSIKSDLTLKAVYDKEITQPIILVDSVSVKRGNKDVEVEIYLSSREKIFGISLDMTFDEILKSGSENLEVSVNNKIINGNFVSDLDTDNCKYELRWIEGNPDTYEGIPASKYTLVLTFKFSLQGRAEVGEYSVNISDSTFIIDEDLNKKTPVMISGSVIVVD